MDSMSGLTSQPNLGSMASALRFGERDPGLDPESMRFISHYWEQVRAYYAAFESDIRSGTSDVYVHGMPGGQYTNLREQARSLGIDDTRWPEVAAAYADVNDMFGDIVKVTPSSKVVGDMAILMVTSGLGRAAVLDPEVPVTFPASVEQFFHGELGQPYGGFPKALQAKVLKGKVPLTKRPGEALAPADLDALRAEAHKAIGAPLTDRQFASWLMYPQVYAEFAAARARYGDVAVLPTMAWFYGLQPGEELAVELEPGKTLYLRFVTCSEPHDDGTRTVFFELNGQPRSVRVADKVAIPARPPQRKVEVGNPKHIGAPMPGTVATVAVAYGQQVKRGEVVVTLEAMKMQTAVRAELDGRVAEVLVRPSSQVDAKDLLVVLA
jgi:pyruvate carboxylase